MATERIIGIDLGTTNSACAIWEDGKSKLIPNSLGDLLTPSAVSFDDGALVVGRTAKSRLISHPDHSVATFKRFMGSDKTVKLGKTRYRPEELSAMVIRSLKEDAERYLGENVEHAVISVPAYFNDIQRKATKQAGEIAGLKVERVINEPSAAALAYGINQQDDQTFVVVDLGGGTFDVSVVECFEKIIEIRASAGDNYLGGEDFLHALEGFYLHKTGIKASQLSAGQRQSLLSQLEEAKNELTTSHEVKVPHMIDNKREEVVVTREDFDVITRHLVERIKTPIVQAIRDSQVELGEIDNVILVGGASRMPIVKKTIGKIVGRIPATTIEPDTLIAIGAGVQAGLKEKNVDLNEHVLTDVCPFTLGIGVQNEYSRYDSELIFSPLLERNGKVPASRAEIFQTISDEQREILLKIFQGESRLVTNNIQIGELTVPVPPNKSGEEKVEVRFSYDMNGILDVDAKVISTNKVHSTTILNTNTQMSDKEIDKARNNLAKIKLHPRDYHPIRLVLARAEKLFEMTTGENRDIVEDKLRQFDAVLKSQDLQKATAASKELARFVDEMEQYLSL